MGAQTLRQLIRLLITTTYSNRRIAKLSDTSPNTVRRYRRKLKDTTLCNDSLATLSDSQLASLFAFVKQADSSKRQPDWPHIHHLMQAKHQTLIQLWEEYRAYSPADAYSYSQFTHYYCDYVKSIDVSMRQYYQPGEVSFVDFAGKRIAWTDEKNGRNALGRNICRCVGLFTTCVCYGLSVTKIGRLVASTPKDVQLLRWRNAVSGAG